MEEGWSADPTLHVFPIQKSWKLPSSLPSPFLSLFLQLLLSSIDSMNRPGQPTVDSNLDSMWLYWHQRVAMWAILPQHWSHWVIIREGISGIHILQRKEYLELTVDSVVFAFCFWTYCLYNKLTYIHESSVAWILHVACVVCILMYFIWFISHTKLLTMHLV